MNRGWNKIFKGQHPGYMEMKRSEDRILTTHVGSLIRPAELLEAMPDDRNRTPVHDGRFGAILEQAIKDVVRKQADAGIDIINDGEFGKSSWANYILERISGFENRPDQKAPVEWLGRDPERFDEFFASRCVHGPDCLYGSHPHR